MNPEIDNVGVAILKGVCNPEAKDLAVDLAQFEIGSLFDENILKEIPGIKLVIATHKTWTAIRDQLFLRKVSKFLLACPSFTDSEKEIFINEHLSDRSKAAKLGECLMLLLDRLDDMDKPAMLSKIFAAFARGRIDLGTFKRLGAAIDSAAVDDLNEFAKIQPPSEPGQRVSLTPATQTLRTNLARTGLVSLPSYTQTTSITGVTFRENELGKKFRDIMNDPANGIESCGRQRPN